MATPDNPELRHRVNQLRIEVEDLRNDVNAIIATQVEHVRSGGSAFHSPRDWPPGEPGKPSMSPLPGSGAVTPNMTPLQQHRATREPEMREIRAAMTDIEKRLSSSLHNDIEKRLSINLQATLTSFAEKADVSMVQSLEAMEQRLQDGMEERLTREHQMACQVFEDALLSEIRRVDGKIERGREELQQRCQELEDRQSMPPTPASTGSTGLVSFGISSNARLSAASPQHRDTPGTPAGSPPVPLGAPHDLTFGPSNQSAEHIHNKLLVALQSDIDERWRAAQAVSANDNQTLRCDILRVETQFQNTYEELKSVLDSRQASPVDPEALGKLREELEAETAFELERIKTELQASSLSADRLADGDLNDLLSKQREQFQSALDELRARVELQQPAAGQAAQIGDAAPSPRDTALLDVRQLRSEVLELGSSCRSRHEALREAMDVQGQFAARSREELRTVVLEEQVAALEGARVEFRGHVEEQRTSVEAHLAELRERLRLLDLGFDRVRTAVPGAAAASEAELAALREQLEALRRTTAQLEERPTAEETVASATCAWAETVATAQAHRTTVDAEFADLREQLQRFYEERARSPEPPEAAERELLEMRDQIRKLKDDMARVKGEDKDGLTRWLSRLEGAHEAMLKVMTEQSGEFGQRIATAEADVQAVRQTSHGWEAVFPRLGSLEIRLDEVLEKARAEFEKVKADHEGRRRVAESDADMNDVAARVDQRIGRAELVVADFGKRLDATEVVVAAIAQQTLPGNFTGDASPLHQRSLADIPTLAAAGEAPEGEQLPAPVLEVAKRSPPASPHVGARAAPFGSPAALPIQGRASLGVVQESSQVNMLPPHAMVAPPSNGAAAPSGGAYAEAKCSALLALKGLASRSGGSSTGLPGPPASFHIAPGLRPAPESSRGQAGCMSPKRTVQSLSRAQATTSIPPAETSATPLTPNHSRYQSAMVPVARSPSPPAISARDVTPMPAPPPVISHTAKPVAPGASPRSRSRSDAANPEGWRFAQPLGRS